MYFEREYRNVGKQLSQSNIKQDFCIRKSVRDSVPVLLGALTTSHRLPGGSGGQESACDVRDLVSV